MKKWMIVLIGLTLVVAATTGAAFALTGDSSDSPEQFQVPAPIESVEILVMEIFPVQYSVLVISGLPNGCASFAGYWLERSGNTIKIEIINWKPADVSIPCTDNYRTVKSNISLGTEFESGSTYVVVVNDVTETFVAQ